MGIYKVTDRTGKKFLYNDDNVFQVCWAWENNANLANYSVKTERTSLGNICSLDANTTWILDHFGKKFVSRNKEVESIFQNEGGEAAIRKLVETRMQAKRYLNVYFDKVSTVQAQNVAVMKQMDRWIFGAKAVRDMGASIVVVGSSVVTMPAAAAAAFLTAGSGIKAYGKYQDTGNVGAAAVEFVCEMGVGMLAVGAKAAGTLSKAESFCVTVFAKLPAEAVKSAVGGDSLAQTVATTLTAGAFPYVSGFVKGIVQKVPVPAIFKEVYKGSKGLQEFAESAIGVVEGKIEDIVKDGVKNTIAGTGKNPAVKFNVLKGSHIASSSADEEFVRKYCITRV